MRGCVSAGMATAVWYLGLKDSVDIVYVSYKFNNKTYIIFSIKSFIDYFNNNQGSSAGSLVGAYFISGQLPYFGPEIYYDVLTTAGEEFIDKKALLRSLGVGILDVRFDRYYFLFFNL